MNKFKLISHWRRALELLREEPTVFWLLGIVAFFSALPPLAAQTGLSTLLHLAAFAAALGVTPLVYGICATRLTGSRQPLPALARTVLPGYLLLVARMYLPALGFALLPVVLAPEVAGEGHFYLILLCFSLIYLYVIPLYFITGRQRGTIYRGCRFLARNLSASTPLLLVTLLVEAAVLLVQLGGEVLLPDRPLLQGMLQAGCYLTASIIDTLVFIVLVLVLLTATSGEH